MSAHNLLRTSIVRASLFNSLIFSLVAVVALSFLFLSLRQAVELQIDRRLRLEADYLLNLYSTSSMELLADAIQKRNEVDDYGRLYFLNTEHVTDIPSVPVTNRTYQTVPMSQVIDLPDDDPKSNWPIRLTTIRIDSGVNLTIGHETRDEQNLLDTGFQLVIAAALLTFLTALGGALIIGYKVHRRIESIHHALGEIADGNLAQRLDVTPLDDEFDQLSSQINAMLNRLEDIMRSLRQVTNNIAHDLRSPLTRIRNRLEVALISDKQDHEYRAILASVIDEASRMISTFNALLEISRAEGRLVQHDWEMLDVATLAEELVEFYEPLAEDQDIKLTANCLARATLPGSRQLLTQAINNLIENALKYCPSGTTIEVVVSEDRNTCVIQVRDTGPGIPEADREAVLERFVRLESERRSAGNGLGLALVRAIINGHRGKIRLFENTPHGLVVDLRMPKRRGAAAQVASQKI